MYTDAASTAENDDNLRSTVTSQAEGFTYPNEMANASTKYVNINQNYVPAATSPTGEDVITHEVGSHNMAGHDHPLDANNQPAYPFESQGPSLRQNKQGLVQPNRSGEDTKDILNKNMQQRGSLYNGNGEKIDSH